MNKISPLPEAGSSWPAYWALLLAGFMFLQAVAMAVSIPRGVPPDELAHISYVMDAAKPGAYVPNYTDGVIVNSAQSNYLIHPPLYYTALGLASRVTGLDPMVDYKYLRIVSAGMVGLGFLCWLLAARNMGISLLTAVASTIACCAVPMFAYAAGSVNNDELAYLGAGLCIYGLSRTKLDPDSNDALGFAISALGIFIAVMTKANVGIFLVALVLTFLCFRWRASLLLLRNKFAVKALIAAAVPCLVYYLYVLLKFGTLFPAPGGMYPHAPPLEPLSPLRYGWAFAVTMWERLPLILAQFNIMPFGGKGKLFFYGMIVVPVVAWLLLRPGARKRGASDFSIVFNDSFLVALAVTLLIHVYVGYGSYLDNGLLAGLQPRYYAFVLPGLWLLPFTLIPSFGTRVVMLVFLAVSAGISFWASAPMTLAKQAEMKDKTSAPSNRPLKIIVPLSDQKQLALDFLLSSGATSGSVDDFRLDNGRLTARGWVFDLPASASIKRVWVLRSGLYLGATSALDKRPDVAAALGDPNAENSGFSISVDDLPSSLRECDIQIVAEYKSGTLGFLRDKPCQ